MNVLILIQLNAVKKKYEFHKKINFFIYFSVDKK